jgi:hypothetical protein
MSTPISPTESKKPTPAELKQAQDELRRVHDQLIFGLLREIRASAQYLQKRVVETLDQASKLDPAGRTALMARLLGDKMWRRIDETITPNLARIDKLFGDAVEERDWCSDSVEFVRLNWLEVSDLWPGATVIDYEKQRQQLEQVKVPLDQIIYQCASLTLSPRVSETLKNLRVGQPLDWDFEFGPELPTDPELSKRLLEELAQEGGVLDSAVVDVEHRLIYKVAKSRAAQSLSALYLALIIVACGIGVPWILSRGVPWMLTRTGMSAEQYPFKATDLGRLYGTLIFILIGSGVHVAIEALKAARAQTRPSFQAMNNWILWLHVRFISILWGLAWILLGYVLLSWGMPKLEWQTAFFAGYSIDSVTALFLARFETTVKTKTQQLTGESKKPEAEKK